MNVPASQTPIPQNPPFPQIAGTAVPAPKKKNYSFLCTLNFALALVGYPVVMALLSPLGADVDTAYGENALYTWPYRIFATIIGVLTLLQVRSRPMPKMNAGLILLCVFWAFYLIRAFYDLEIQSFADYSTLAWAAGGENFKLKSWAYILAFTLLPLLGVLKGFDRIDFERAANWIWFVGGFSLIAAMVSVQRMADAVWTADAVAYGRFGASKMLNTIALGHLGVSVAIVAVYKLTTKYKTNLLQRFFSIGVILVGTYIMLRAGSRGPVLCAFVAGFFYALSRSRYAALGIMMAAIFAGAALAFIRQILMVIRFFSETMSDRILRTIEEGDDGGRLELYKSIWSEICDHPIGGVQLDLLGYSHNACLDGFMMFGFLGGWIVFVLAIIAYVKAFRVLRLHLENWWLALLAIQAITSVQTSGMFGPNSFVQCTFVVCLIWTSREYLHRRAREQHEAHLRELAALAAAGVPVNPPFPPRVPAGTTQHGSPKP